MDEAFIYIGVIIIVGVIIFGLCLYGSRVQRISDESRDYRKDIEREQEEYNTVAADKRELEEEQRDRTESLKQNNRTAREANNRIGEILRNKKPIRKD